MKDHMIPIGTAFSDFETGRRETAVKASYPDAEFWMQVYPPMSDIQPKAENFRAVCPWAIAGELNDAEISFDRRKNILDSLKTGLRTMRQYDLPARRIRFMEYSRTRIISVWVD
ncbi:MAG: hypothetical protein JSU01_18880 [Bacteroidetes bacterium]|nr:hypothetical protein [Bacteroidota bacterium]